MNIPLSLRSKDTVAWSDESPEYQAPTFALTYLLRGPSSLDVVGTGAGATHTFLMSSADSGTLKEGVYQWQLYASDGTSRFTIATGTVKVLPSLDQIVAGFEARSSARVMLENLEKIMRQRSTEGFESVTIGGRSVTKMKWADILLAYNRAKEMVKAEDAADNIAAGLGSRRIVTRFLEST